MHPQYHMFKEYKGKMERAGEDRCLEDHVEVCELISLSYVNAIRILAERHHQLLWNRELMSALEKLGDVLKWNQIDARKVVADLRTVPKSSNTMLPAYESCHEYNCKA